MVAYAVAQWKRSLREPMTLGWTLVLPVMLLLLFGGAPGGAPAGLPVLAQGSESAISRAAFLTMGLIGLNTVSIGIFGLGTVLVQARQMGILQRLVLTPQPAWTFVGGHLLAASAIVGISALLLLLTGGLVFDLGPPRRLLAWCAVLGLGCLTFLAIGYALAASLHEVRTAQVVGNTALLLFMCFGGVWSPLQALPPLGQWLSMSLPLLHFLEALRGVGCLGQPLHHYLPCLAILAAWSMLAAGVAMLQFRWRQEE
jgi:ABC-type multidrug transport system permease subunit